MDNSIFKISVSFFAFLLISYVTSIIVTPFTVVDLIGPCAGVATALTVILGNRSLIGVIAGSIVFNAYLHFFVDYQFEFSIFILSILGIALQSLWAKQVCFKYLEQQKWLSSRASLLAFILRLGPGSSFIAGVVAVLTALLTILSFDSEILYTFVSAWVGSVLVAVFLAPMFLFAFGKQALSIVKRTLIVVASVLGGTAIALLFYISQIQQQQERYHQFNSTSETVIRILEGEIESIDDQLLSVSSLFRASDFVSDEEFLIFASNVFTPNRSLRALEWIPAVLPEEKQNFEDFATLVHKFDYQIIAQFSEEELGDNNNALPHLPVFYIYPVEGNQSAYGLDLNTHMLKRKAAEQAIATGKSVATAPLTLVQDDTSIPSFLVFKAIYNQSNLNSFGFVQGEHGQKVQGFILAVVQFDQFIKQIANNYKEQLILQISDSSSKENYFIYGEALPTENRLVHTQTLSLFGREWQVELAERYPYLAQSKSWQDWSMLLGVSIGGFLFQMLILMMAAYSTELSFQVGDKTRKLILQKEKSEKENSEKTKLLQTLSDELKLPLAGVINYIDEHQAKTLDLYQRKQINALAHSAQQLTQLIENIADLSSLEDKTKVVNTVSFDFQLFLDAIEGKFRSNESSASCRIRMAQDVNLPSVIKCDSHKLERLLLAAQYELGVLFPESDVKMNVKPHFHHRAATLFFTCNVTHHKPIEREGINQKWFDQDISQFSTRMALIKEICILLGGNLKLSQPSDETYILAISIKVDLEPVVDSSAYLKHSYLAVNSKKKSILLFEEPMSTSNGVTSLLLALDFQVEIIDQASDLSEALVANDYDLVLLEGVTNVQTINDIQLVLESELLTDKPPVLGVYRGIDCRQLPPAFKPLVKQFLIHPFESKDLNKVIDELCSVSSRI